VSLTRRTALAFLLAGLATADAAAYDPSTLVYPPFRHCLGLHKVTTFHLFVYLGTRTHFNEPGAVTAVKFDSEDDRRATWDDDELTVLGLNTGECEIIYNTSLTSADVFGECGSGPGQFLNPQGIAAEPDGDVYVADTGNDRIVRLRYENDRLRFADAFGSAGTGPLELSSPSDVAVGSSGRLYIADTGNDRVVIVTPRVTPVAALAGDPASGIALDGPSALAVTEAVDPWTAAPRDAIVVVDRGGTRLTGLSGDGRSYASVLAGDLPLGNAHFDRVAIDFYGSVYVTDTARCQIHKFDRSLSYVASFGRRGTERLELLEPRGITIWRRFGQVFVTEKAGAQYFWMGTEIRDLRADPSAFQPLAGETRIRYALSEYSRVTVEILDADGAVVHTPVLSRRRAIGENAERWNGTGPDGRTGLPGGTYTVRVTARPTYAAGSYFSDTAEFTVKLLPPRSN